MLLPHSVTLASLNGLVLLTHRIRPVSAKLGIRPIWEAVPFRSASPKMALPTPPGQSAALDLVPPSSSSLSPSTAPVVTGTGPNFSLGELQGHLAYDLNPASTGMRRTLPSTSSSGYVPGAPPLGTSRPPPPPSGPSWFIPLPVFTFYLGNSYSSFKTQPPSDSFPSPDIPRWAPTASSPTGLDPATP